MIVSGIEQASAMQKVTDEVRNNEKAKRSVDDQILRLCKSFHRPRMNNNIRHIRHCILSLFNRKRTGKKYLLNLQNILIIPLEILQMSL